MGVFTRPDSKHYWLYLEAYKRKERTNVLVSSGRKDLAEIAYQRRMEQFVCEELGLPPARPISKTPRPLKQATPRRDGGGGVTYIYFVSDDESIKIGRAVDVEARMQAMQSGHPRELRLLGAFLGYPWVERRLHQVFAADRVKGEWFKPSTGLVHYIERINRGESPLLTLVNPRLPRSRSMTDPKFEPVTT